MRSVPSRAGDRGSSTRIRAPVPDYRLARHRMVERLERAGYARGRVAEALRSVPRHHLVPEALHGQAYRDTPLPIGSGQTISAPSVVAVMTQAAEPQADERVLEVGTGSAYQAAVLAHLAEEVISVERVPSLAAQARRSLDQLRISNVVVHFGDGSLGRSTDAPFDVILVTAAGPEVPPPLLDQLASGGRLVGPFGPRGRQELLRVRRDGARGFVQERLGPCRFVELVGKHGWSPSV